MAWTTPATSTVGQVLTAAWVNTYVRDNTNYLYGGRYRKTTEKDVVNTTTETDLLNGEITVAAGLMETNRMLRATLVGDALNASGAPRNLDNLKVKFGGATLYDDASIYQGPDAVRYPWMMDIVIANLGATNSQILTGVYVIGVPGATTAGIGDGGVAASPRALGGTGTVDTTAACLFEVTVKPPTALTTLSIRLKYALVEIV